MNYIQYLLMTSLLFMLHVHHGKSAGTTRQQQQLVAAEPGPEPDTSAHVALDTHVATPTETVDAASRGSSLHLKQSLFDSLSSSDLSELCTDVHFSRKLLSKNGLLIQHMPECIRRIPRAIMTAVQQNGLAMQFVPDNFKGIATRFARYDHLSRRVETNIPEAAIRQNPLALRYVGKYFKYISPGALQEAMKKNGMIWRYIPEPNARQRMIHVALKATKYNEELVLDILRFNGMNLRYVSEEQKNTKDIVLTAVKQNGLALRFANTNIKSMRDVIYAAIENNGFALIYASEEFHTKDIFSRAFDNNNFLLLEHKRFPKIGDADPKFFWSLLAPAVVRHPSITLFLGKRTFDSLHGLRHERNRTFLERVLRSSWWSYHLLFDSLKNEKDLLIVAMESYFKYKPKERIQYFEKDIQVPWHYLKQRSVKSIKDFVKSIKDLVELPPLSFASEILTKDKDIMLDLLQKFSCDDEFDWVKNIHGDLLNNAEFMLKAVGICPAIIKYGSISIKSNKDIVVKAVAKNGILIQDTEFAVEEDRGLSKSNLFNEEVLTAAVSSRPLMLKELWLNFSGALDGDGDANAKGNANVRIIKQAIRRDPRNFYFLRGKKVELEYISLAVSCGLDVIERVAAYEENGYFWGARDRSLHIAEKLWDNPRLMFKSIENGKNSIRYVPNVSRLLGYNRHMAGPLFLVTFAYLPFTAHDELQLIMSKLLVSTKNNLSHCLGFRDNVFVDGIQQPQFDDLQARARRVSGRLANLLTQKSEQLLAVMNAMNQKNHGIFHEFSSHDINSLIVRHLVGTPVHTGDDGGSGDAGGAAGGAAGGGAGGDGTGDTGGGDAGGTAGRIPDIKTMDDLNKILNRRSTFLYKQLCEPLPRKQRKRTNPEPSEPSKTPKPTKPSKRAK